MPQRQAWILRRHEPLNSTKGRLGGSAQGRAPVEEGSRVGVPQCAMFLLSKTNGLLRSTWRAGRGCGATSIEVAAIGRQTVEAARERRLDIILSDARLQEGTCPAAVASIQCELGDIPAIFITGSPTECQPRSASAIVLTKLFDNAAMLGVFRNSAPI